MVGGLVCRQLVGQWWVVLIKTPKDPPDWTVLNIWALLNFISVDIFLAKAFLILVVCLVVRNKSCGNSSSSMFFLFIFNIVHVLFFAGDFNLFNCVSVKLIILSQFFEKILILLLWSFPKLLRQIKIDHHQHL